MNHKLPQNNHRSGFTLVETMLAFIISSMFLLILGYAFTRLITVRQRILTSTNLQKTGDQTLLQFTQEARWAQTTEILSSNSIRLSHDLECITYTLNSNQLEKDTIVLKSNNISCSGSIPHSDIDYQILNEVLNPPDVEVTEFNVINRSSDANKPSIEVTIKIHSQAKPDITYSTRTVVTPRNKIPGAS